MAVHVLTKNLVSTLRHKHRIDFSATIEVELRALQDRFVVELFDAAIDPQDVTILEESDIVAAVNDYLKSAKTNVLSCDDVFGRSSGNPLVHNLDLSRIMYSFQDRTFGMSERHPFPPSASQFADSKSTLLSRGEALDCTIYDLGIYGGRFMAGVVELALKFGFKVNTVATCITRQRGLDRLKKRFDGLGIAFETLRVEFDEGWDELRDIIGLHGFLVDSNSSQIAASDADYGYIPYEEIISWFSLPLKNAGKFREVCRFYRDELNRLFARESLKVTISPVGKHEDVLVYALKKLE